MWIFLHFPLSTSMESRVIQVLWRRWAVTRQQGIPGHSGGVLGKPWCWFVYIPCGMEDLLSCRQGADPVGTPRPAARSWGDPCRRCAGQSDGNSTNSGCASMASVRARPVWQGEKVGGEKAPGMGDRLCLCWQPAHSWAAVLGLCRSAWLLSLRASIQGWVGLGELLPAWHDGVWCSQGKERMGSDCRSQIIKYSDAVADWGAPWAGSGWRMKEYPKEGCCGFGHHSFRWYLSAVMESRMMC